jgi:putative hydrolase of the HAD superfamily
MRAVLFDFGGTIDTNGVHWSEKYWELYQRFGAGVEKADYERSFVESERLLGADPGVRRATFKQTIEKQLALQFGILKIGERFGKLHEMADACYADVRSCIGAARSVIMQLQKNYALGLVSNFYGNLDVVTEEFGLRGFFQEIVDSAVVGIRKPDPAIFGLALKRLKCESRDAYVVGDSYERDIVPGKKLGCATIWLKGKSWTEAGPGDGADHIISGLEELITIIPTTA